MAVTLGKNPQLLFLLAVTTGFGAADAKVHNLVLTYEETYADQLEAMHRQAAAIDGATVDCLIAGDRSAAYAVTRTGQDFDTLLDQWLEQEAGDDDAVAFDPEDDEPEIESIAGYLHGQDYGARVFGSDTPLSTCAAFDRL
ncbi:hypothetical protein [Streptomyces phaeoluteigriseus]